jgi:alpha-ketoglutarate-dependent taurine dioxygenase
MARIRIDTAKKHVGGIVHVSRATLCDDDVVRACTDALEDRGVLVFPQINLSDAEQLAFTDKLGPRVNFTKTVPGGNAATQDVYKITLDPEINDRPEYVQGTFFWHIDGITMDMPLPKATLLSARKLSANGGQTEFANLYAAYSHLPENEKLQIAGLRVWHRMAASMRPLLENPTTEDLAQLRASSTDMQRPLVWQHASGRRSLLVGTHADSVVGMPIADGRALLARLAEWAGQPEFRYTHQWQEGDLVLWDNCGMMHRVIPYAAKSGRSMHRTTIEGVETTH